MRPQLEQAYLQGLDQARNQSFGSADRTLSQVESALRAGVDIDPEGPRVVTRQLEYARVLAEGGLAFVDGVRGMVYDEASDAALKNSRTYLANLAMSRFNQSLGVYQNLRAQRTASISEETVPIHRVTLGHARTIGNLACARTLDGLLAMRSDVLQDKQEWAAATRGFYFMADQKFADLSAQGAAFGYDRALNAMRAARHEWIFTADSAARWKTAYGHWIFRIAMPALASTWRRPVVFAKTLGMITNRMLDLQPGGPDFAMESVINNF